MNEAPLQKTSDAINLKKVVKQFGGQLVLDAVDFAIAPHEFVSLVGPSGCGKSTLLRLIAGLETIDSGSLSLPLIGRQKNPSTQGNQSAQIGETAFVFQESNLLPWLSAFDNVALPFRITGRPVDRDLIESTLDTVGISAAEFAKLPKHLSGGMKMRISIARALVLKPKVLLMDEPFAALDDLLRTQLNEELLRIWDGDKLTIVFVTHNISEAIFMSQRVAVMGADPGRIHDVIPVSFDYPREKSLKSSSDFAKCFARVSQLLEETNR